MFNTKKELEKMTDEANASFRWILDRVIALEKKVQNDANNSKNDIYRIEMVNERRFNQVYTRINQVDKKLQEHTSINQVPKEDPKMIPLIVTEEEYALILANRSKVEDAKINETK